MKIVIETPNINFRPKMSLSFAKITSTPREFNDTLSDVGIHTNVSKEIARDNPSYPIESTEIAGNGYQGRGHDRNLQVRQK